MIPAIEEQKKELLAAGWKQWGNRETIWQAPFGRHPLFLGPHQAWKTMKQRQEALDKCDAELAWIEREKKRIKDALASR